MAGAVGATVSRFRFDPAGLSSAIARANRTSFKAAQADAKARLHERKKSGVKLEVQSDTQARIVGTGLAAVFEEGRQGGYPINPSGTTGLRRSYKRSSGGGLKSASYAVRGTSGGSGSVWLGGGNLDHPLAYATGGPMRAYPALHPAASNWVHVLYPRIAKAVLAGAGFSAAQAAGKALG